MKVGTKQLGIYVVISLLIATAILSTGAYFLVKLDRIPDWIPILNTMLIIGIGILVVIITVIFALLSNGTNTK